MYKYSEEEVRVRDFLEEHKNSLNPHVINFIKEMIIGEMILSFTESDIEPLSGQGYGGYIARTWTEDRDRLKVKDRKIILDVWMS